MPPDLDVLLELPDHFAAELGRLALGAVGVLTRRPTDVDHEPDVGGELVDRGDRRDGAVVDHPPALGHRDAQAAVDGLDAAVDVLDLLPVVTFERDGEVDERHRFGEVMTGEHGHDGRVVHEFEMREIDTVFEHVLRMQLQGLPIQPLLRVVVLGAAAVAERGEDVRRVEIRLTALDVVPDVDRGVALHHGVGADATAPVGPVLVGNADVSALLTPLPAVERALQHLADDRAAITQMRTEVLAVGVHHGELTGLGPPRDHLLPEVLHRVHVAHTDLVGPGDLEPAGWCHRQRRLSHAGSLLGRNDRRDDHQIKVPSMKLWGAIGSADDSAG